MYKLKVYEFNNESIDSDILNEAGKVMVHKRISIIARSENHARSIYKWKHPSDEYLLVRALELNRDWDVPVGGFFRDNLFTGP